ncbi:MAG TPA: hypothetical protein VN643_00600 [Pyrinomonadaceae bacterium]|nr:hypothetical protein [Pyrinomonadaceae bacterium]
MRNYFKYLSTFFVFLISVSASQLIAQKPRIPAGGRVAIVVDERLSAVRSGPGLTAPLEQRLGRGRFVAIVGRQRSSEGLLYYNVKVSARKRGWLQSGAIVILTESTEDDRLLRLLKGSEDFDLVVRARIFLEAFPRSQLRPIVLKLYAEAAEEAATKLSRDASRRLNHNEMVAGGAPEFSYFMNFNGLDRYNRQGIRFTFDAIAKRFHYDGAAWREILRRYPLSTEAAEARKRLDELKAANGR